MLPGRAEWLGSDPRHGGGAADAGPPTRFEQRRRLRWAQLIRRVWLEDPLLCPECGGDMHILSFITEPGLVGRILRHVGWHPGDPAPDLIRAPPPVLKVAESPS